MSGDGTPGSRIAALYVRSRDLKMLRETLCRAQSLAGNRTTDVDSRLYDMHRLQWLIDEIDMHRPLDKAGKHGSLHTPTCGCKDKT